jgi:hypothetical protein
MESSGSVGTRVKGRARPAELIALVLALEERDQQDERDRRRLDREIGARALADSQAVGLELLRVWLDEAPSLGLRARLERVRTSLSLLRWIFVGVGLFLGWATAAMLLQFEVHAGRINIVICVALLVLVPLGMLVLACAGAFWPSREGAGNRAATGGFVLAWRRLALARLAMSLLSASVRADVEILLGRMTAHARLYARVERAQLFVWSQWLGLAFGVGALVATLVFVVFTDLAFGWSTTLDVQAESVHRVVSILSAPWASLWPSASPSLDLVETTRHFRVAADEHIHFVDPIRYGGWWPFLVASLLFYGLLPRVVVAGLGTRWLGREVGIAIALSPGVDRLIDRLTTPIIETQATTFEAEIGHAEAGLAPVVNAGDWIRDRGGERPMLIRWAEASDDATLMESLGAPHLQVRDAGGRRSLPEDADLVTSVGAGVGGAVLCVRGFEPPVLEVLDFLTDLRSAIGRERALMVLLVGGTSVDNEAWRHKLMGLGDPGLSVAFFDLSDGPPQGPPVNGTGSR